MEVNGDQVPERTVVESGPGDGNRGENRGR